MADDNQQEQQEGEGRGASTAVKAAAAVAATGAAAYGAKKALSHRGGDNDHSSNGSSSSRKGDMGEMLNSVLAERIDSLDRVTNGDLAWKHENGSVFKVEDEEETQAISSGRAGAVSAHVRPKVHVTLWRSVADSIDAAAGR